MNLPQDKEYAEKDRHFTVKGDLKMLHHENLLIHLVQTVVIAWIVYKLLKSKQTVTLFK